MSAREVLSVVSTAVGGLIGWSGEPPPAADPSSVRHLLEDLGLPSGSDDAQVAEAVRIFQVRVGLRPDGVAGPRTVHELVRYAAEVRDLRDRWSS
jgi:peptidoglycan hydrolase-like protein with peptidoglycan-binding domain